MKNIERLEVQRQSIQSKLDGLKTQEERNIMGQFSTPISLAIDILKHAKCIIPKSDKIVFLDPAFGTGSFYSALNEVFPSSRVSKSTGYEIDEHYGKPSKELWENTELDYRIEDFTKATPPTNDEDKYNLIICNPPYVRHHHINGHKERLQELTTKSSNMKLSGLSGLYCYFIGLSHCWIKPNGISGWLIPSEFMDVNYGQEVKRYLLNEVTLLQIHRFDPNDVQFDDALVSSAVVWFKNTKPDDNHKVQFTYGGTLDKPHHKKLVSVNVLGKEVKWTRFPLSDERVDEGHEKLSDFFKISRGIATGDNKFFVLSPDEIAKRNLPLDQFRPILPSPRYLKETVIDTDENGYPLIENPLFVLDSKLSIDEIETVHPSLYDYLMEGIENGVSERYLCRNKKSWYAQEKRQESYFYCTYIGRSDKEGKKPFRFILNHSKAIVANSYLVLYPKPELKKEIDLDPCLKGRLLESLNQISGKVMIEQGRVYGGGMHKMEPKELANVPAPEISRLLSDRPKTFNKPQQNQSIRSRIEDGKVEPEVTYKASAKRH